MTRFRDLDPASYELPEQLLGRVLSPALVVYLERVRENVRRVIAYAGGRPERWRPHVKTTKIAPVFAEVARAGVRHFKCATLREARLLLEVLRASGTTDADVLLAQPLVGPALAQLGLLAARHPETRVAVLSEDPELARLVPEPVTLFVDVDPGMHRTGVPLADRERVLAVARAAGPRFRGVHAYDGHLHAGGPDERRRAVHACYDAVAELLSGLARAGVPAGEVVTSGTPSFLHGLAYPGFAGLEGTVHRVSPGTVVFHDLRSELENADLDLVPAALVLARVVSHPAADVVTCDAGSKSIAAEAGDPCAAVLGRPELEALAPSEEHLPLRVRGGELPARGTPLLLFPRHVCPTINLAEEALLVAGDGSWELVPVAARAHDVLAGQPPM